MYIYYEFFDVLDVKKKILSKKIFISLFSLNLYLIDFYY